MAMGYGRKKGVRIRLVLPPSSEPFFKRQLTARACEAFFDPKKAYICRGKGLSIFLLIKGIQTLRLSALLTNSSPLITPTCIYKSLG